MSKNQVIIIGGGISGLAAAVELVENGIRNIVILEAQNRLGGRIFSIPAGDNKHVIELGAQWIHGEKGNPIYELCSQIDIVDKETKTDFGDIMYYCTQDGMKVDDDDVEQVFEQIENLLDEVEDEVEAFEEGEDHSLGSMMDTKFNTFLSKIMSKTQLTPDKVEIVKAIYQARMKEEKAQTACDNLNELSAAGYMANEDFDGDSMVNLKFGYGQLIQYLCSKLPADRIFPNEIVKKIQWPEGDKPDLANHMVTVTAYNSEFKTESVYYGYQCLCTVPLGHLKATYKELFEPKLPGSYQNAIERLGFGIVNKLFLVFDEPLFKQDVQGLQILWRDDLDLEMDSIKKWNIQYKNFFRAFTTFEVLPNMKNVLYTFVIGEAARYIEQLENKCLVEILHEMFTKCFTKITVPMPKVLIKSAWASNEFTRGSYSYIKLNSSVQDVKALSQPLNSKLHFAGEATDYRYMGTVHGAYRSGIRAARNIMKILKID